MKIKFLILSLAFACTLLSCTDKKHEHKGSEEAMEHSDSDEWPDMDSFHMVMAEAFHAYKDSTNLEPAKRLAEEMAKEAETWASSSLPEKVNTEAVKAQLNKLKADTRSLADQIKNGASDEIIGVSLKTLHDSFHGIMESWNGASEGHEHEH
ncbi:MAG: hypothetical protein JNM78_09100 [Cyclobacteriaceae bacterium]|nr:hypothetical protein [Cyclobacteriaceae bacterium]